MSDSSRSLMVGVVTDLVSAILAVNLWTVEKVFSIHDGLEREGVFDHERIASAKFDEVHASLIAAGYDRGDYIVSLLTERLQSMAHQLCGWRPGATDRPAGEG